VRAEQSSYRVAHRLDSSREMGKRDGLRRTPGTQPSIAVRHGTSHHPRTRAGTPGDDRIEFTARLELLRARA
jgi:hypothetical protein